MIKRNMAGVARLLLVVAALGMAGCFSPLPQAETPQDAEIGDRTTLVDPGVSNFIIPTYQPTSQPGVVVENNSAGSTPLRIENASGTPVAEVYAGGGYSFSGAGTVTDLDVGSGSITADLNTEHFMIPSVITATVQYTPTSGTVATIGAGEVWVIWSAYAKVATDFDCTGDDCAVNIGDGNDADGLLDLDDAELQSADTEGTGAIAGWQGFMSTATRGAYLANGLGFVYDATAGAETIDYAVAGTDPAAGLLDIYIFYTRVK